MGRRAKEQRGVEPPAYFSGIYTCTTGLCCCSMYWLLQAFGAKAHKLVYGALLSHKRYCNARGRENPWSLPETDVFCFPIRLLKKRM